MSISYRNTINTGIHGPSTGQNPLEACFPQSPCPFWAGMQPFGHLCGTEDRQGTISPIKWRNADWVTTQIGTGGAPSADLTPVDGLPATATLITDDAVDGDGWGIQWSMDGGTTVNEIMLPTAGLGIIAFWRFKVDNTANDAHTKARFYAGLSDTNTDIHNADDDLIMFYKASGAATMVGRLAKAGTATDTSALANSVANDTYIALGIRVNGVTSVEFWQGTTAHDMTLSATQTTVTNIADEALSLSFTVETSEAASVTATLQHAVASQEAY